jgi:long-chain acyl-CoA synthetase
VTAPPAPIQSLVDLLDASVARYPSRPLFLTKHGNEWLETTYQQFRRLVDGARSGLAQLGVSAGDRVGIIAGNRVEWAAIAYASYELAATLVPMYESQLASDWAFIVGDAGIKVLFVANRRIQERLADLF